MILEKTFSRICLVSLPEQKERRERACKQLLDLKLAKNVEYFPAVNGRALISPKWWPNGKGAWGCYLSHLNLITEAFRRGDESILILEDDVVWLPDAAERLNVFFKNLPADWGQVYLGGQYRGQHAPAWHTSGSVVLGTSVHRTHAFAVHQRAYKPILEHLWRIEDFMASARAGSKRHIDHHLEIAHQERKWNVYCPPKWVCGQGSAFSTIRGKFVAENAFWQPRKIKAKPSTVIMKNKRKTKDTPFIIFSSPRSMSTLLMRIINSSAACKCNGERREFLWSLKSLAEHREKLMNNSPHSFLPLNDAIADGQFPSHHNNSTDEGWATAIENILKAWCGATTEKSWGMKDVHIGKNGASFLFEMCDWLRLAIPGIKIIFLTRDVSAVMKSIERKKEWWIPSYATSLFACEKAVTNQQAAFREYHELHDQDTILLDAADVLNYTKLSAHLKKARITISKKAFDEQLSIKI